MRGGLFKRLAVAFIAVGVLVVAIAGLLVERQLRAGLTAWIEAELVAKAEIIAQMPAAKIGGQAPLLARSAGARLTLIDAAGRVTADTGIGELKEGMENHLHRSEVQEARLRGKGTAIRYSQTEKMNFLYAAIPLAEGGYVRLARPLEEATGSIDEIRLPLFWDLVLVVCLVLVLTLIFTFRAVSPIVRLAAFTDRIRQGDLTGMIRVESPGEIGRLATNINEIIAVLQEKIRAADEKRGQLESVFAGMSEGLVVLDAAGRIETVNRGMAALLSGCCRDAVGKTLLEALRSTPLHDAWEAFRRSGEKISLEIGLGGDRSLVLDVTISAVPGGSDRERKALLVFHDVTRLKQLEQIGRAHV